jgi:hypothetical protein
MRPVPPIDVQVRTFIPDAEVMLIGEIVTIHGDNRTVSQYPHPDYRIYNGVTFDPNNIKNQEAHAGINESIMYIYKEIFSKTIGTWPEFHQIGTHTPISNVEKDGHAVHVLVENEGTIPRTFVVTAVAPAINYKLEGMLYPVPDGTLMSTFTIQHDGFPGYEVYVNGNLVYSFDPRANGQWVPSLSGSGEFVETFEKVIPIMPYTWP